MPIEADKNTDSVQVCLWLDFYGPLLTERTRDVLDLYFACDLSLAEIAENLKISRQAVHDKVKQGVRLLQEYESKLSLTARHSALKQGLLQTIRYIDDNNIPAARSQLGEIEDLL